MFLIGSAFRTPSINRACVKSWLSRRKQGDDLYSAGILRMLLSRFARRLVFSDRLDGSENERNSTLTEVWNKALDGAPLAGVDFAKVTA